MADAESLVDKLDRQLQQKRDEARRLKKRVRSLTTANEQLEKALVVETELRVKAAAQAQAARDWIDRQWKALSKTPERGGHRAASLTILEADLDAAREGGSGG